MSSLPAMSVLQKCGTCGRSFVGDGALCFECDLGVTDGSVVATESDNTTDLSERDFARRFEQAPLPAAFYALARNALAGDGFLASQVTGDAAPLPTVVITEAGENISRDACDFVAIAYRFLAILDIPQESRDFVLAVCALSGGDASKFHVMPDPAIADLLGYHRNQIKAKREALIAWQQKYNWALIDIIEGERDPETRHYLPTQYRARVVPLLAIYLQRARALGHFSRNPQSAIKQVVTEGEREIVDEIMDEHGEQAPMVRRRRGKRGAAAKPRESLQTLLYSDVEKLNRKMEAIFGNALLDNTDPYLIWEQIARDAAATLDRITENYPQFRKQE